MRLSGFSPFDSAWLSEADFQTFAARLLPGLNPSDAGVAGTAGQLTGMFCLQIDPSTRTAGARAHRACPG
jgi:hypothetical protein